MKEFLPQLCDAPLFAGIDAESLAALLPCLGARQQSYEAGAYLVEEGDVLSEIGVVVSGTARAFKWDAEGGVVLISLLTHGSEIGALLAASGGRKSPVTVQADSALTVLFLTFDNIVNRCSRACEGHERLMRNAIALVAEKGLLLHERIRCLLQPSIRAKVLAYLAQCPRDNSSGTVCVPLDRNAMAQYLNVERSALSRELSRMKRDGLLQYHKNKFIVCLQGWIV